MTKGGPDARAAAASLPREPLRLLHYGMGPNLGGIETFLYQLAKRLDPERFHCDFLYSDNGRRPHFADELGASGSAFHGVTPRRVSLAANRRDLESLFATGGFDALHFHSNTASYVEPIRAALRHGVPAIWHSHNAGASRSPITQALHRWNSRALRRQPITRLAVSEPAGRWMFGHSADFQLISNGIDIDRFRFRAEARERIRRELEIGEAFVVGHVGGFRPAKNHAAVLAGFAEVLRRQQDAVLVLIGSGPGEAAIQEQARRSGLADRVRFLGDRDDVPSLYSAMDCLLFPSRYEGFGLVVLEAQASGLPCYVSTAVPAEVAVLPSCRRFPLSLPPTGWAEAVLDGGRAPNRSAAAAILKEQRFGVADSVHRIEAIYTDAVPGRD